MTTITNKNLEAHYATSTKVQRPKVVVASAPNSLPNNRIGFSDQEANKKIKDINTEIYKDYQTEKQRSISGMIKFVSATALAILAILGIKKLFFKKS